jgi:hypothetical protein
VSDYPCTHCGLAFNEDCITVVIHPDTHERIPECDNCFGVSGGTVA